MVCALSKRATRTEIDLRTAQERRLDGDTERRRAPLGARLRGRSVVSGYPSARSKHFMVDVPTMPNADSVALTVGPGALAHTAQE